VRRKEESSSKASFRGRREIGNDEEQGSGRRRRRRHRDAMPSRKKNRSNGGPPRRRCTWQLPRKIDIPTNRLFLVFPSSFPRLSLVFPSSFPTAYRLSPWGRAIADFSYLDRRIHPNARRARAAAASFEPLVTSLFSPSAERAVGDSRSRSIRRYLTRCDVKYSLFALQALDSSALRRHSLSLSLSLCVQIPFHRPKILLTFLRVFSRGNVEISTRISVRGY